MTANNRKIAALFAMLCTLASCGGDPLPKPELLNHPQSEWTERTKAMSTKDLYHVYRYYQSLKPPYDSSFADYLGVRGKAAIKEWIFDLESGNEPQISQPYRFGEIIQQSYYKGGYDLCSDPPTFDAAVNALLPMGVTSTRRGAAQLIRKECVSIK
jgi:hypothetical protein